MRDAIEGMNGTDLDGRNITVTEAKSRGSGHEPAATSSFGGAGVFGCNLMDATVRGAGVFWIPWERARGRGGLGKRKGSK